MNEKVAYIKKLEDQISDAQTTLNRLKAEKEQAVQQAQHEEIERLEEHLDHAQVRLKDIREAAEEAWQELKKDADELLHKIANSLKKLMSK
ncbi:MAG: hypothetical protein AAGF26_20565 [Cyanobacteria bacterium P01_G01_bin.49]